MVGDRWRRLVEGGGGSVYDDVRVSCGVVSRSS